MTLDEALLMLNDRLGHEVTAWVEVTHETPLLIASGHLENWHLEATDESPAAGATHFDLYGHYSLGDTRFDLSDAPVESVAERENGLTFRLQGGARLVVTWQAPAEPGNLI
ncbi:MAG: hypothetical protein QOJ63_3379 [Solirubrobacteraceae bacterium]|jgi:hypothetical protein|nr:hypothetical protein [Solirubrobacteraceae bacterium]